jgi:cell division initiation protein
MRLTALDIQNQRFARRLRGYEPAEVDAFLRMIAEDYGALVSEAETLRGRVHQLEARVEELAANERRIQETLTTAQDLTEDLKQTARREATLTVTEAEVKAEKIIDAAHRRASKLADDIRELKLLRSRVAGAVRGTLETHLALLDGLTEELPADPILDGKVSYLTQPKPGGAGRAKG